MINLTSKIKNSLAFRSGYFYKYLLSLLPFPSFLEKPELPLNFLTLCGVRQLLMLQQCLFSLYHAWPSLPSLQIVSDGTLSISRLTKALDWWPGEKSFKLPQDCVHYHRHLGRESLAQFAESNVMGLKLAAVLEAAEKSSTLYCDTDVLWFRPLSELPLGGEESSYVVLKMSEDFQQSYDTDLLEKGLTNLSKPPFLCAGLLFVYGELLQNCDLEYLLDCAAKKSNHFTEQTIFAEAAHQLGLKFWSKEEVACFIDDQFSLAPTYLGKEWIARHYVGSVRHLIWRDALALRLGLRKKY